MIRYVTGDVLQPIGDGPKIIAHICNNEGKWGRGFVLALSRRWMRPERMYRHCFSEDSDQIPRLGDIHVVVVEPDVFVVNMIAQNGLPDKTNRKPCSLPALRNCLLTLKHRLDHAKLKASIHMPRIGTGFGGRSWSEIEPIIDSTIGLNYNVTVYDQ